MKNTLQRKPGGYLRTGLILVILFVSISAAAWVLGLRSGMYAGVDLPEKPLVIRGGTLFDGAGDTLIRDALIVIEKGEIRCVGCAAPADAILIDASGKAVLPGLIDMHLHYYAPSSEHVGASKLDLLFSYLRYRPDVRKNLHRAGITAIRSLGDVPANILRLKALIESGEIEGPDVFCAGPTFTVAGGHPAGTTFRGNENLIQEATRLATDPIAGRQQVIALLREGVDGIRVSYEDRGGSLPRMSPEVLDALLAQAREAGRWTAVSTDSPAGIREALNAGATTLERGSRVLADTALWREVAAQCMLVPTLAAHRDSAYFPAMQANVALAAALGVPIGIGSDIQTETRGYQNSLHREMELLVEAGLSPVQVLLGATSEAARFLKVDHYLGTVEAGKRANLIIVDGKPWEQIGDIRKVETVIQGGRLVVVNREISD